LLASPSFTSGQEEGLSLSLTTRFIQRCRILGTVLPVENVQLYKRMVASHEEEEEEEKWDRLLKIGKLLPELL
jgi:hypothetical protein